MIPIRNLVCLLVCASLIGLAPSAAADPDPLSAGHDASADTTCVDVNVWAWPPVAVYDCPWAAGP